MIEYLGKGCCKDDWSLLKWRMASGTWGNCGIMSGRRIEETSELLKRPSELEVGTFEGTNKNQAEQGNDCPCGTHHGIHSQRPRIWVLKSYPIPLFFLNTSKATRCSLPAGIDHQNSKNRVASVHSSSYIECMEASSIETEQYFPRKNVVAPRRNSLTRIPYFTIACRKRFHL